MTNDELMQRGREKCLAYFESLGTGEQPNDYSVTVWAVAEVMRANGHEVEPGDLSYRWHDPLCSIPSWNTFEVFKRGIEETYRREIDRASRHQPYSSAMSDYQRSCAVDTAIGNPEREGEEQLRAALKREKIRANTKKWRESFDRNRERFIYAAREQSMKRINALLDRFADEKHREAHDVEIKQKATRYAELIRDDLKAIDAAPELIDAAQTVVDKRREAHRELVTKYDHHIERLRTAYLELAA